MSLQPFKTQIPRIMVAVVMILIMLGFGCERQVEKGENTMQANHHDSLKKATVARVWQGRTTDARADEYEKYNYEEGIKKIAETEGNLGVQVLRLSRDGITEFTTISYWTSREDIKRYAGEDIQKPHHLPKDKDYCSSCRSSSKTSI